MHAEARSDDPALDRLLRAALALHPQVIDLSLGRIRRLLAELGDPHLALPPVFHVAGTNGKGSTVAFLRACLEASGRRVHVYTSPHLVRFNERIRLGGALIGDEALAALVAECMEANRGEPITFFELVTAAAFLAFAREPAHAVLLEVGLGGRLDATNVVEAALVTGIAALGLDHQKWLGNSILQIAAEKAGIAKAGTPLVHGKYPRTVAARVAEVAGVAGARVVPRGLEWDAAPYRRELHYRDGRGLVHLPLPRLAGPHQLDNAALAVAMLRHQEALPVPEAALRAGMGWAEWPARLQRLDGTPVGALLPPGAELWLDGGHNPQAARALADTFRGHALAKRPLHLIVGMLDTKDAGQFMKAWTGRLTRAWCVPVPGHAHHAPVELVARAAEAGVAAAPAPDVAAALGAIAAEPGPPPVVLVAGSLHLAGGVLARAGVVVG